MDHSAAAGLIALCPYQLHCLDQETSRSPQLCLVDLRSFMLYRKGTIKSSVNLYFPRMLIKKNVFSFAKSVANLPGMSDREKLSSWTADTIVLFDESSQTVDGDSQLRCIYQKMIEEGCNRPVFWLQGLFTAMGFLTSF